MIAQLEFYRDKLLADAQFDPRRLLLMAQDDEVLWRGSEESRSLCTEILAQLGSTALFAGYPQLPYVELLLEGLAPGARCAVPLDSETRTFLHDIPLVRAAELAQRGAAAVVERLQRRKGVLVEGVGLVASGALTVEQGYVNFSSLLHALSVKVLLDLLTEPLPAARSLANLEPLWAQLRRPLPRPGAELGSFDPGHPEAVLTAMERAGRCTVELGLVDSFFGNISAATDNGLYISQTGASLDRLAGCIDLVPGDDSSCAGLTASSELAAHRAIYAAGDARTILHGHPRFSVVLSLLCEEEGCRTVDCWKDCARIRQLNAVPVVAGEVGAGGLARSLPQVIGQSGLALVYGHGVFATGGNDYARPLGAMLEFESWCRKRYLQLFEQRLDQRNADAMDDHSATNDVEQLSTEGVIQLSKKARRLFRRKEYARARDLYRQGLRSEPANPYLLSGLGDACREAGEFDAAQQAYQTLLDHEPNNLFALRGLGDLYKGRGALAAAIPCWENYLRRRPNDVHVMTRIADACKSLERFERAEALYRQVLELDPRDQYALTGLADLLHLVGRDHDAIACYEKVLTLRHDILHILTIVGKLCWRVSDFDKAERFFLRALDIDPDNPYALYGLGNCYRWHRNYAKAVEVWQRILLHNEGTIALYTRLGDAFTHLGDHASAEQAYRQVLDQGYDRYAQIGIIKLCCDQADFGRAIEELNNLLANEKDPWPLIEELSQRFVRTDRRKTMVTFCRHLLDSSVPNCLEPERIEHLLTKLEE